MFVRSQHLVHDPQVVGDEDDGDAPLVLDGPQQVEDRRLHGDVEPGFVGSSAMTAPDVAMARLSYVYCGLPSGPTVMEFSPGVSAAVRLGCSLPMVTPFTMVPKRLPRSRTK